MARTPSPTQGMLSIAQVAARQGVAAKTVRRWIAEGRLPAQRVGPKLIRIAESDLERVERACGPIKDPVSQAVEALTARPLTDDEITRLTELLRGSSAR